MNTKARDLSGSVTNHTLVFECRPDKELVKQDPIITNGTIIASIADNGSLFGYKVGDGKTRYSKLPYINYDAYELKQYTQTSFYAPEADSTNIIDGGTSNV